MLVALVLARISPNIEGFDSVNESWDKVANVPCVSRQIVAIRYLCEVFAVDHLVHQSVGKKGGQHAQESRSHDFVCTVNTTGVL